MADYSALKTVAYSAALTAQQTAVYWGVVKAACWVATTVAH